MVSAVSTTTAFFMPETSRLVQWPVIVMVLEIPLTMTALLVQAIDLFSLMPLMVTSLPGAGGGDVEGIAGGIAVMLGGGAAVRMLVFGEPATREVVVLGDKVIDPVCERLWATPRAMMPASATTPTATIAPTIHQTRAPEGGVGGGPAKGPPP